MITAEAIPDRVIREVLAWKRDSRTGSITLHFRAGKIAKMERDDTVDIRDSEEVLDPKCPSCGERMEPRDFGQKFVCETILPGGQCGTKRTRAQVLEEQLTQRQGMP